VHSITWGESGLALTFRASDDGPVILDALVPGIPVERRQPLVELMVLGEGRALSNIRMTHSGVGRRLRFVEHEVTAELATSTLRIVQRDPITGLQTTSVFVQRAGVPAFQTWTEVRATGPDEQLLQTVSSFATGALLDAEENIADVELWRGRSDWCSEGRWSALPVTGPEGLASINTEFHHHDDRGALTTVSTSTWSSGTWLPTAVLANSRTGRSLAFQLEHNGAWRWELDALRDGPNALALALNGPTDLDHQWTHRLAPGEQFTSIPVSIAVSSLGYQGALASLTHQRRAIRRPNAADAPTAVVFNDYMNTLMGDPTTEKLLLLIDAAAGVGAEYFCIDAGWYDDGGAWWGSVGEWKPSTVRFPDGGLRRVLDHIRARGMHLGLWLEPEVIGVRSPVAQVLPDDAFLQRFGRRVVEHDRYFLDLRHPAAIAHLDEVVDRLVGEYGARFFKLDYNVTPGAGTDVDAVSAGDGLLEHNRAHLAWIDRMVARHPRVIFENCASGAMRLDYAMMSRLDLQSTSDQQDFRLSAAISASAPASLLPEQAANWAYPQPGMPPEELAFALVNGLAGRLYLSGKLDGMSAPETALVTEAVDAFTSIRGDLAQSVPFWPLGLPGWHDEVLAVGFATPHASYLAIWNRAETLSLELPVPHLADRDVTVSTVFPRALPTWHTAWDALGALRVDVGPGYSARLLRLATE
jgi:alpha-galactosidase